ncbi:hypothetical protein OG196_43905 (plasmid) [Kitasatospora purpeofusca]|uniref:hypothetical protein n=1 Tax=Kitasatospora purpeofusca TaxID=67352 RepID=UPI002E0E654B|nr:hypothetical protein OG196_43905 [Kitasatospora purpeofusca]
MTTTRRQAAHDTGEDIWTRVAKAGEDGLLKQKAIGHNTQGQFERGKAWIKDTKCKSEKKAWVYHHGAYTVTLDPDKCTLYASDRLRSLYKQAVRIYDCSLAVLPPEAQKLPTVRLLTVQCQSIIAAMDVLEASGFSPETAVKAAGSTRRAKTSTASRGSRKPAAR